MHSFYGSCCTGTGKSAWPELLGSDGHVAAAIIKKENPLLNVIIVPERWAVIPEVNCRRVWVWVNSQGKVKVVPIIG